MKARNHGRSWQWAIGLLVAASTASASQAVRLDLERMTRASDEIVVGKVARVESRWTPDRRMIVTEIQVTVSERLKGTAAKSVTIVQPGGVVGDIGQKVSGMPRFRRGDEVVLFLERHAPQRFVVTGMAQGKFRIERSSDGRSAFAVPEELAGLELIDPAVPTASGTELTAMPLEVLRRKVQQTVRGGGTRP